MPKKEKQSTTLSEPANPLERAPTKGKRRREKTKAIEPPNSVIKRMVREHSKLKSWRKEGYVLVRKLAMQYMNSILAQLQEILASQNCKTINAKHLQLLANLTYKAGNVPDEKDLEQMKQSMEQEKQEREKKKQRSVDSTSDE